MFRWFWLFVFFVCLCNNNRFEVVAAHPYPISLCFSKGRKSYDFEEQLQLQLQLHTTTTKPALPLARRVFWGFPLSVFHLYPACICISISHHILVVSPAVCIPVSSNFAADPLYQTVSRCIPRYPAISVRIQLYLAVSSVYLAISRFVLYLTVSHRLKNAWLFCSILHSMLQCYIASIRCYSYSTI